MRERRTFALGSKFKTRLLIYFFAVTLMPIIAMAVFSYLFMNRALDRWFTETPEIVVREAQNVQNQSIVDRSTKLDNSARMLATIIGTANPNREELQNIGEAGSLVHIGILSANNENLADFDREITEEQSVERDNLLAAVRSGNMTDPSLRDSKGFDLTIAEMSGGRKLVIIPDPISERAFSQIVETSLRDFDRLKDEQNTVRQVGLLTLGVLTFLLIFASSWIAFYVARGLTAPIKALAEGADEIARGNLGHRVDVLAEDELALLVTTFNEMSAKLESNSIELSERRKYFETVLETLPTGVISFDPEDRVSTINRAAVSILKLNDTDVSQANLVNLVNEENRQVFERLIRRARRVGHSSDQTVLKDDAANGNHLPDNELTVALTASVLPAGGGVVLVIEDLSELIAAQRASAWQEVARRMAHEIKNPLTPIQLSAERIAKRFAASGYSDNGGQSGIDDKSLLGDVVDESTATILREVSSLKTMVDAFSRFARMPETKLEMGNLNDVINRAATVFDGRFKSLTFDIAGKLPDILIDAEQMKRVFVNLIENSIEAFEGSADEPAILVKTRHDAARDLVVAEISDNGKGIATSDLQKLFQPYFSTKGRGTGLGLAIVNRIITEHHGRIKVVGNQPKGAKFIIELPVNG